MDDWLMLLFAVAVISAWELAKSMRQWAIPTRRRVLEGVVRHRDGHKITMTTTTATGRSMHLATFRDMMLRMFPGPEYQLVSVDLRPARRDEV